jgi:hypothetical protein
MCPIAVGLDRCASGGTVQNPSTPCIKKGMIFKYSSTCMENLGLIGTTNAVCSDATNFAWQLQGFTAV